MTRPLAYWHSAGSLHARGGLHVSEDMALALVDLYGDELRAAFAAGDNKAVADACLLLTDLRTAMADLEEYRKAQRGFIRKPGLWERLMNDGRAQA